MYMNGSNTEPATGGAHVQKHHNYTDYEEPARAKPLRLKEASLCGPKYIEKNIAYTKLKGREHGHLTKDSVATSTQLQGAHQQNLSNM